MNVIDADGHVTETQEQVARYLDEPYRRRPTNQFFYPWDGWDRRMLGTLGEYAATADAWLKALDRGGMEMAVLYPTLGLFMSFLHDRQWAVALCRAYNSFMHEEFTRKSPRLKAVALLPLQDPAAAAMELRRAVRELGCVGAMLAADGAHVLGAARFTPIYEEAERLDTMLGVHASGSHLGGGGLELFPAFIQTHTCSHAFGQMRQLTSLVLEGIPERFPRLRIAFLEAGCGWAPYWIERMDEEYAKRASEAPVLRKKPSDYVRSGKIYAKLTSACCRRRSRSSARSRSSTRPIIRTGTAATRIRSTSCAAAKISPTRRSARCSPTTRGSSTGSNSGSG